MIKDLLIVIDNSRKADNFLREALIFAERYDAFTEVLMLSPGPIAAADFAPLGALFVPDEVLRQEEAERLDVVRRALADALCPVEVHGLRDDIAWLAHDFRREHPVVDLILMGTEESWEIPWLRRRALETSLLATGTPLLIMPSQRPVERFRRAVLGWKPSREANRAVHDLVALADPGATIEIAMVGCAEGEAAEPHVAHVQRHLERHGFKVTLHLCPPGEWSGSAEVLEHLVRIHGADLLAVGGYAHSRVREIMFGGVTRELVAHARVPVLLSH